jgi:hypothetical protein
MAAFSPKSPLYQTDSETESEFAIEYNPDTDTELIGVIPEPMESSEFLSIYVPIKKRKRGTSALSVSLKRQSRPFNWPFQTDKEIQACLNLLEKELEELTRQEICLIRQKVELTMRHEHLKKEMEELIKDQDN